MRLGDLKPQPYAIAIACGLALAAAELGAQQAPPQPPAAGAPPGQAPGGGRGRGMAPPAAYDDYTGFTKLWDGSTFTNWDGERDVWTIEDGMLHADTVKNPGQHHIHYIGPNAVMKDFDLKVEFKISQTGANGGIQYRSRMLHTVHGGTMADPMGKPTPPNITTMDQVVAANLTTAGGGGGNRGGGAGGNRAGAPPGTGAPPGAGGGNRGAAAPAGGPPPAAAPPAAPNPMARCGGAGGPPPTSSPATPTSSGNIWQVSGYQFDLDSNNVYTGQLYEGQGRSIVTAPGTFVRLLPGPSSLCVAVINENPVSAVKPHLGKDGDWQQVEIIARGNTLIHILNGHVMSVTIDDNPDFRALAGILSLQLEGSGQIWYRNVYVKHLN
jgi:hypothetical protein